MKNIDTNVIDAIKRLDEYFTHDRIMQALNERISGMPKYPIFSESFYRQIINKHFRWWLGKYKFKEIPIHHTVILQIKLNLIGRLISRWFFNEQKMKNELYMHGQAILTWRVEYVKTIA